MMVRIGNLVFRIRNYLFPLALPLVLVPGPRVFASNVVAAFIGLAIAVLGQSIRATTIGLVYIIRGGRDRRVYAEDLITDGIYAHSRNPMYVGNLLIVSAVALTSNSWGCLGIVVPLFAFLYLAITRAEENYLGQMFGAAYGQYCADVPRFLPKMSGLLDTLANSTFHWRRLLAKEYGTFLGWPLRWALVVIVTLWLDEELADHDTLLAGLGFFVVALLIFYGTVRSLKKRRLLVAD